MRLLLAALSLSAGLASAAMAQTVTVGAAGSTQPPLRCGVDGFFAPHAFSSLQGGLQGFQIDLFDAIGKKMGMNESTIRGLLKPPANKNTSKENN